jgi:hypothetical protein
MTGSRMAILVFWAAQGVLAGCAGRAASQSPPQPEIKPAPATPIAEKKADLGEQTWDPEWDRIVEEALPPEMLSARLARDVRPFCPRFKAMSDGDKRAYWAYFFQALAGAEAGLVPTADVRHTEVQAPEKDSVTKRTVRSEGLLQLTFMDAERYGCDFDWDKDKRLPEKDPAKTILQPRNNLTCGIKILENQLIAQRKPLLSRSSYWATLRPGGTGYRVFAKQMKNVPAACRLVPSPGKTKPATARVEPAADATQKLTTDLK